MISWLVWYGKEQSLSQGVGSVKWWTCSCYCTWSDISKFNTL